MNIAGAGNPLFSSGILNRRCACALPTVLYWVIKPGSIFAGGTLHSSKALLLLEIRGLGA